MHLLPDALSVPGGFYPREQTHDTVCPFSQLSAVENDIVMVKVETERDIELFADG